MRFDYWISQRLRVRKGVKASTSTGATIAVVGVALALIVMEISIAITIGFKAEIRLKVMGFDAPIAVLPAYNRATYTTAAELNLSDTLLSIVSECVPESEIVGTLHRQAILKTTNDFAAVECVGRDTNHNYSFEISNIVAGKFPNYSTESAADSIVISKLLASQLDIKLDERIYLYFFVDNEIKARRFNVAGFYESNFNEYDKFIAYTSLKRLQNLSNDSLVATSIDIENIADDMITHTTDVLQNTLINNYSNGTIGSLYPVTNIFTTGAIFFNWLDLLDTNVVIIFILMLCVAIFTLISSLFIIILDRIPTIGILRSLGASNRCIARIFLNIAMRLVGLGMLIGNIVGIGIIALQYYTHLIPLDPRMYYLSYVPVELNWIAIIALNIGFMIVTWLVLILPARLAAKIDPAQTMRYE